jgi:hypothetical protein
LEEAVKLGITNNITPETFREASNYLQNKTLTLKSAISFANIKENDKIIFAEVEIVVEN